MTAFTPLSRTVIDDRNRQSSVRGGRRPAALEPWVTKGNNPVRDSREQLESCFAVVRVRGSGKRGKPSSFCPLGSAFTTTVTLVGS